MSAPRLVATRSVSPPPAFARDDGVTLMEVMITTFLTLTMLGVAFSALDDGLMMKENASLSSEMHHNSRIAMGDLSRDFVLAGQGIPTGGIPVPSGPGTTPIVRSGPTSMTFPAGMEVLGPVTTGNGLGPSLLGMATDIVTIVFADSTLDLDAAPLASVAFDGSTMTVDPGTDITLSHNALAEGDLIMFSNAYGHAIQHITSVSGHQMVTFAELDSLYMNQRSAPAGTILQLQSSPGVFPPTTATRVWMHTYFIDTSVPDSPRLMRAVNSGDPRAVAMEIEGLQLTYDLVDGVANPTDVAAPVSPNSEAQIRKANIAIYARSYKKHVGTGEFQRHMLSSQTSLRNLSFFDRYQ